MNTRRFLPLLLLATALLAPHAGAQSHGDRPNIAILLFDHVQIIDIAAPYEVLGAMGNVYTVAETKEPITGIFGMKIIPDYGFDDYPEPDIVILPGGGTHRPGPRTPWSPLPTPDKPEIFDWVRTTAEKADVVMSVCNGAFILARANLLDGLEATTTFPLLPALAEVAPNTTVRNDRRFVDNGKIVLSAGLTAGMDAALHVVEKLYGRGMAQRAALGLEYDWDPEGNWTRAALADKYMLFSFDGVDGASLSRQGDQNQWRSQWLVTKPTSVAEILALVDETLSTKQSFVSGVQWTKQDAEVTEKAATSHWTFTDPDGGAWYGTAHVEPADEEGAFILAVEVERQ